MRGEQCPLSLSDECTEIPKLLLKFSCVWKFLAGSGACARHRSACVSACMSACSPASMFSLELAMLPSQHGASVPLLQTNNRAQAARGTWQPFGPAALSAPRSFRAAAPIPSIEINAYITPRRFGQSGVTRRVCASSELIFLVAGGGPRETGCGGRGAGLGSHSASPA